MKDKYLFLTIGCWGSKNSKLKRALHFLPWKVNKIRASGHVIVAFLNGHQLAIFAFSKSTKAIISKHLKGVYNYRKLLCIMRTFSTLGVRTIQSDSSLLGFLRKQKHTRAPRPLRFASHILVRKAILESFCFGTQKRRRTHLKMILHRCKIYSTTGIRIYGNLH